MDTNSNSKPLVLVLEDEALIGLNLRDDLQDAGYRVEGPFTTCAAALSWLEKATPDTAILDAALKDGPCRAIAQELTRREVLFLIYSGYHEDRKLLAEFPHVTWIEKPAPCVVSEAVMSWRHPNWECSTAIAGRLHGRLHLCAEWRSYLHRGERR